MPMMSYAFPELLEWAANVSGIYSLVTRKKSSVKLWGMGRRVPPLSSVCAHTATVEPTAL